MSGAGGYSLGVPGGRRAGLIRRTDSRDGQGHDGVELRVRAGTLIAAAAITTSFFGGHSLLKADLHFLGWLAVACFALVGLATLLPVLEVVAWVVALIPHE